ncbi:DUF58 domain-containing protein [Clostridium hydrogeniformans]|uniref:DUF58 domain-containing protein n=1 Tax=Clostridium hydrogeniformans TaxID=349933 RepID=UPI00048252B3|nr:DUF58 domain-containing protein [Clostridium hydrogeniformans]
MAKINISKRFLVLFVIVTCFSYLQGDHIANSIFYGILILFIMAILYNCLLYKSIEINITSYKKVICAGESMRIKFFIFGSNFFAMNYIFLHNKGIASLKKDFKGQFVSLNIGDSKILEHDVNFIQRGVYPIGDFNITLKDIFSIVDITFSIKKEEQILVYPKLYDIGREINLGNTLVEGVVNKYSLKEDLYSIKDLREYVGGDRLKDINWKVSAKKGDLYVKTFDNILGEDVALFVNMHKENYFLDSNGGLEEKLIDFSLSLIKTIVEKDLEVIVNLNNRECHKEIINKDNFKNFYNNMIFKPSDGEENFKDFINLSIGRDLKERILIFIILNVEETFLEVLGRLNEDKHKIIIFYNKCEEKTKRYIDNLSIRAINFNEILVGGNESDMD